MISELLLALTAKLGARPQIIADSQALEFLHMQTNGTWCNSTWPAIQHMHKEYHDS